MPYTQNGLPFSGSTPDSAHASWTGAMHAAAGRSANIDRLRDLWREPRTINQVAVLAGLPLSSVCSLKQCISDELEAVGFQVIEWGDGRRPTKRTKWRVKL